MKITSVLSGGLDSTVLTYKLLAEGLSVRAVSICYGQRHQRELSYAARTTRKLGIPWRMIDLSVLKDIFGKSSQTSNNVTVPHGHYEEEVMKLTVVPNRNMILLAVAAGWAIGRGDEAIAYAAHAGDHAIYPDCRPVFVDAMVRALQLCHYEPVILLAPFLGITKADIVKLGDSLGVPFAETWSCYEGGERHCGLCGTCVERKEAFVLAGMVDPTEYLA